MNGTMWLDVTHHQLITKAILYWLDSFFGLDQQEHSIVVCWWPDDDRVFVKKCNQFKKDSCQCLSWKTFRIWTDYWLHFGCISPEIFCLLIVSSRNHFSNYTLVFKICKIINWIYIIHLGRLLVWFYCFQSSCYFPNPINCVFGYLWMRLSLNF